MSKTYSDAIIVGLISLVVGSILFDMLKKLYLLSLIIPIKKKGYSTYR